MGLLNYNKLLFLLLLLPFVSFGQNISGRVNDKKTNVALVGALVTLYNNDKIVGYTTVKSNGEFALPISVNINYIECSFIGYKKERKEFVKDKFIYNFLLEQEVFKLNEVYVKAPAVEKRSDTIEFNVASYATMQDRKLEDVIKKIPGLQVADNGSITYNGEAINKFYIEGGDMLGGNYSLATKNISPKDVKSVEVLENHQPIKSLKDSQFSDKTALNIKLKENVKYKWIGSFDGGGGYSNTPDNVLYDASLFGMQVGGGAQYLLSGKANNSGKDILQGIDFQAMNVANLTLNFAPLSGERTRMNNSYLGSFNLLKKLKNDFDFSVKMNYGYEKLTASSNSLTSYILKDSILNIYEFDNSKSNISFMNGSVGIKANKDAYYLSNLLSFNYLYNNINSLNFGSFNVNQNLNSNFFIIKNNLEYVKTYGLNTIRFNSDFKYSTLGEKLVIQNDSIVSQNVNPTYLDFNNFGEFTIKKRDFLYSLKVNGNLKTYRIFDNYGDFYLDFNPYITYKTSSFRASLNGLFGYNFYFPFNKSLYNYSFSTSFKYDISSKVALFALFNLGSKLPNTSLFYNGYLLSDYRNVNQGFIYFKRGLYKNFTTYLDYRDPINQLMGKLSFNMNFNDNMLIKENLFFSNYILSAHLLEKNNSKSWGIKGEFSVGIRALNGKFSVESYYGVNRSEVSQNGILTPIKGESFNIKPTLFIGFSSFVNAELNLNYSSYKLFSSIQKNLIESITLNLSPNKRLNFKIKADHFANWIGEGVKNTFFLDSEASYSKGKWRFYLSANNILNQNVYDYNKIIDLTSYTTQYFIRGRNIMFGFSLTF